MHYKTFEWMLYRSGCLSQRMMDEMTEHLYSCEECLEMYLSTLDMTPVIKNEGIRMMNITIPEKGAFSGRMTQRNRSSRIMLGLLALLILFLFSFGFTPQGRIVYAQIRSGLQDFGNSLIHYFGLPEDTPYVQDVGLIQNTASDITFTVANVTYKAGALKFVAKTDSAKLPKDVNLFLRWKVKIDGVWVEMTGQSVGNMDETGVALFESELVGLDFSIQTENINGIISLESVGFRIEGMQPEKLYGPWTFKFGVSSEGTPTHVSADAVSFGAGFDLSLDQVLMEREGLVYSFIVRAPGKVMPYSMLIDSEVLIDGKRIGSRLTSGVQTQTYDQAGYPILTIKSCLTGDDLFKERKTYPLEIVVHEIVVRSTSSSVNDDTRYQGDWRFRFEFDNSAMVADTVTIPIQKEFEWVDRMDNSSIYRVVDLEISPLTQILKVEKNDSVPVRMEPFVDQKLGLFVLESDGGESIELVYQSCEFPSETKTIYYFAADQNAAERMKNIRKFTLVPYLNDNQNGQRLNSPSEGVRMDDFKIIVDRDVAVAAEPIVTARQEDAKKYDLSIKLDQALLQQHEFVFSGFVKGNFSSDFARGEMIYRVFVNGKPYGYLGGSGTMCDPDDPSVFSFYAGIRPSPAQNIQLKKLNHLRVSIDRIILKLGDADPEKDRELQVKMIEGPWMFDFDLDGTALENDTKVWLIQKEIMVDEKSYTLLDVKQTPMGVTFAMEAQQAGGFFPQVMIVLEDGSENLVQGGHVGEKMVVWDLSYQNYPWIENQKSMTVLPYIEKENRLTSYFRGKNEVIRLDEQAVTIQFESMMDDERVENENH